MKFISQLFLILLVSLMGEVLYHILPFPIPSGIYGLILMFILLITGIIKIEKIEKTGLFLIEIMPLMFIAPITGLIGAWSSLSDFLIPFIFIVLFSTIVVMIISGKVTQKIIQMESKNK